MKVTVVGTGSVGLVSGACLAELGNDVLCMDLNPEKIRTLEAGDIPIFEPGWLEMMMCHVGAGRLRFTTDAARAVHHGTIQSITVGTLPEEGGSADMQHVLRAARSIGRLMTDHKVAVDKSTVPVGMADFRLIKKRLRQPLIVEDRNRYDPALVRSMRLECLAIGR